MVRSGKVGFCRHRRHRSLHHRRRREGVGSDARDSPTTPAGRSASSAAAWCSAKAPASSCSKNTNTRERRGATILAEFAGAGMSADAGDIVLPSDAGAAKALAARAGRRAARARRHRLHQRARHRHAGERSDRDRRRSAAYSARMRTQLAVSSTKSMHGHALGAAGAIELIAAIGALRDGVVPPTANFIDADPECDLDYVPNVAREMPVRAALSIRSRSAGSMPSSRFAAPHIFEPSPSRGGLGGDGVGSGFRSSVLSRNRLTSLCFSSAILAAGHFLLLAQKKVTKENGTLGFAPLAERAVRYGRTGFAHRPSMACCRESARSLAPPACGARGCSVHPPPLLRGDPKSKAKRKKKKPTCRITDVAYIRCFCGRDCRALLFRVPSRPRQGLGGKAAKRWPAGCRPLRREHMDVLPAKPSESLRSLPGMDARQTAAARVPFSLVTFFWASKRK